MQRQGRRDHPHEQQRERDGGVDRAAPPGGGGRAGQQQPAQTESEKRLQRRQPEERSDDRGRNLESIPIDASRAVDDRRLHNQGDVGARGVFEQVRPGTVLAKCAVDERSLALECGTLGRVDLVRPADAHRRLRDRKHPEGGEHEAHGQQGDTKPAQGPGPPADAFHQRAEAVHATDDSGGSIPAGCSRQDANDEQRQSAGCSADRMTRGVHHGLPGPQCFTGGR